MDVRLNPSWKLAREKKKGNKNVPGFATILYEMSSDLRVRKAGQTFSKCTTTHPLTTFNNKPTRVCCKLQLSNYKCTPFISGLMTKKQQLNSETIQVTKAHFWCHKHKPHDTTWPLPCLCEFYCGSSYHRSNGCLQRSVHRHAPLTRTK